MDINTDESIKTQTERHTWVSQEWPHRREEGGAQVRYRGAGKRV